VAQAIELPEFVREALEGAPAESRLRPGELEHALAAMVEPQEPRSEVKRRLLDAVSIAPLRYAPFLARLAELFDLDESSVEEQLRALADPRCWRATGLPGIRNVRVRGGAKVRNAETLFVRFRPGIRFPHHRHTGIERVLVLEGGYVNDDGTEYRAGDLHEMQAGTQHSFTVMKHEPCIFASVVTGRDFTAWPLRVLSKVLGRS
jgi:quercetin dioxygenase-like cupin family protein